MRTMYLAAAAVSLIACTVDAPDTSVTSQNVETHNRLASNRLASNRLASNRLASNRLASNSLSSAKLDALSETADILGTHSGRIVYSYIVSCALPDVVGTSAVTISKTGVLDQECESDPTDPSYTCSQGALANDAYCTNGVCTFDGGVGLAPDWVDRKLDQKGQGWVSACLFARVNAHDTAEVISLQGRNTALGLSSEEASFFTIQEGAFYGNLFAGGANDPIDWNVCAGRDAALAQDALRDCTLADPNNPGKSICGFNLVGDCFDYTPQVPNAYACGSFTSGYFGECHADAGMGKWPSSKKYREVITTYLDAR